MGGIIKLFNSSSKKKIKIPSVKEQEKILEKKNIKIMKIHICGKGERKKKVINLLFKSKISKPHLQSKGDSEYKSNDFYWITKIYNDDIITKEMVNEMEENIEVAKTSQENPINFHVMLCFGEENDIEMIVEEFSNIHRPRIIYITENKKIFENFSNQKYVTNIICKEMDDNELNKNIISSLWEIDCYYNEKGNEISRYTPKNLAKGLQTDMSFFSINILLTGMCRSGKSSFINLISEKLVALETNDTESVTLKVSEYYVYRNDNKEEHGAIKLIDTPGICDNPKVNSETYSKIKEFLENKDREIEKQIHFIFFFFMEQATLGHSEDLLKLLNDSGYPVFFIINKSQDTSFKGKSQDIKSKIKFLKKNNFLKLAKDDNFIQVNIKSSSGRFYGVDNIFKKIEQYINENNLLDPSLLKDMQNFQDNYRRSQILDFNIINDNQEINKNEDIETLYKKLNENILFKNINKENIINHGRSIANKYEKNIILLSNLKSIFPVAINNIPIISFLQAFMIKEIGAGYGFDFNTINYCFKRFDRDIIKLGFNNNKENDKKSKKENKIKIYGREEISKQKDELSLEINKIWNNSNQEVLKRLVQRIHELTSKEEDDKSNDIIQNIENTMSISSLCQVYFENELVSAQSIPFFIYYFKKNLNLMKDIKYYIDKKDWEKDEMEIIEKKIII